MQTAILIHGTPTKEGFFNPVSPAQSNSHWFPWVQKQLLIHGYHTWTPEMPLPYAPDYALWKAEFERYTIDERSLLVGHSCGGGFLLRWLSENRVVVHRTILVAPWLDPYGEICPSFFEFEIDRNLLTRTDLQLFVSTNDAPDIDESVKRIHATLPNIPNRTFSGYGHFTINDMKSDKFPELIEALLEVKGTPR